MGARRTSFPSWCSMFCVLGIVFESRGAATHARVRRGASSVEDASVIMIGSRVCVRVSVQRCNGEERETSVAQGFFE